MITVGSSVPQKVLEVSLDLSSVNPYSVSAETFTITGLRTDMTVVVNCPALDAGLSLLGAEISAANTLKVYVKNSTGTAINPSAHAFKVICL